MATQTISPAKAILLAVQAATRSDIATLRTLLATCPNTLNPIFYRILLTYLPESCPSSEYVQLLTDFDSGNISKSNDATIDESPIQGITEAQAAQNIRKLNLLNLRVSELHEDAPQEDLILFLLHRAYRIDEETGLLPQLSELIAPFLPRSDHLRDWMLGTLLPLLRLNYEYHPSSEGTRSLDWFEKLDTSGAVKFLLSRTIDPEASDELNKHAILQDVRGIMGPWLYGNNQWKRRRTSTGNMGAQTIQPLGGKDVAQKTLYNHWDKVFCWIMNEAIKCHAAVAELVVQWADSTDVDLGGYAVPEALLPDEDSEEINGHYAHAALSAAFRIPEATLPALADIHKVLGKVHERMGMGPIPTLQAAASLLAPVFEFTAEDKSIKQQVKELIAYLRNEECTNFRRPTPASVNFFHASLTSTYLLLRSTEEPPTIEQTARLLTHDNDLKQHNKLREFLVSTAATAGSDDKLWLRRRNEILWLHDWGLQPHLEGTGGSAKHTSRGPLGLIPVTQIHTDILRALISSQRYNLARQLYEDDPDTPLSHAAVAETVLQESINAFRHANNPNKTQGGVKQALNMLEAFPKTFKNNIPSQRIRHLAEATHIFRTYRLILDNNEPWKPDVLLTHGDPIAIVEKVLAQNTRKYTKIDEFLQFGELVVRAGLTVRHDTGMSALIEDKELHEQLDIARWRITAMCIDAALSEDDFETAYSYVIGRLPAIAGDAYVQPNHRDAMASQPATPISEPHTPMLQIIPSGAVATRPLKALDTWSWRAAFQAGKYKMNAYTIKPSHVGNSSANPVIRNLEQKMDCLGQALRIAPPAALQEILNVFRRCEEELDAKIREEAWQEENWDRVADEATMPGNFAAEREQTLSREGAVASTAKSRTGEAPMSLFDLTRRSAEQAQKSLKALTAAAPLAPLGALAGDRRGDESRESIASSHASMGSVGSESEVNRHTVRKRDQLRSAAVGTLAGGIGWLIGAPVPQQHRGDEHEEHI